MQRGTGLHAMLFKTKPVVGYDGTRRGKDWEAFKADHPKDEILPATDFAKAEAMVASVRACKLAQPFLEGVYEETLAFTWYGMNCRVTPDVRGRDFVTELKSCPNASPERFIWHSLRMAYHAQLKWQMTGMEIITLNPVKSAYVIAVEYNAPFVVQVFKATEGALQVGARQLAAWMERLKVCEASNAYPAYTETIAPLDVPQDVELDYGDEND